MKNKINKRNHVYLNLEWSLHCSAGFFFVIWYSNFIAKAAWLAMKSTEMFGSLHHNHQRCWGILVVLAESNAGVTIFLFDNFNCVTSLILSYSIFGGIL